jgi:hypothetical protein
MQTLPELLIALWGRKRAKQLAMEYRMAFANRPLLLADLAKRCDIGAVAPKSATEALKQSARQEVFNHIARILQLRPEDFTAIADGKDVE